MLRPYRNGWLFYPFHSQTSAWIPVVISIKSAFLSKALTFIQCDGFFVSIQNHGPCAFTNFANADTKQFMANAFAIVIRVNL
jgi:hypothetical protein